MNMFTYRVTEKKLTTLFGEELKELLNPFKTKEFLGLIIILFIVWVILLVLTLIFFPRFFGYLIIIAVIQLVLINSFFYFCREKGVISSKKMKDMVTDPEIVWLNSRPAEDTIKRLERKYKGIFNEDSFKILAYLKKYQDSRGMHNIITSLQNSNSTTKKLKRLHEKNLVMYESNDFQYNPWQFKIVDDHNQIITDEKERIRLEKIEKLLNKSFERMIDGLLAGE